MIKSNSKKMKDNITAIYVRISREDGNDESYSIVNQKKLLSGIAKKLNLTNINYYIDDGITGTKLDREQYMKMCEDVKNGLVKNVLVKDLSRLSRDQTQAIDTV